jgi:hypothetical protein
MAAWGRDIAGLEGAAHQSALWLLDDRFPFERLERYIDRRLQMVQLPTMPLFFTCSGTCHPNPTSRPGSEQGFENMALK